MSTLKGTRTEQNLLKSFAGESQARSRYTFFAEVAKKEGDEQIAGVFLETAEQEREHAKRFFNFLEGGDLEITACYPAGKVGTCKHPREFDLSAHASISDEPKTSKLAVNKTSQCDVFSPT